MPILRVSLAKVKLFEAKPVKELASIPLPALNAASVALIEPQVEWMRAKDGAQLATRVWRGQVGQPVVLYLHGIEGHGQWFQNTASHLNRCGITVYAQDRRGSGLNSRDRGHLPSYKIFLADQEIMLRRIATQHAGHPLVLFGNCWGGKAASLIACDKYQSVDGPLNVKLSGLVLTCPAIYTKVDFDTKTKLQIALDCLRGDRLAMRTTAIPLNPGMFTDNEAYLDYLMRDPLRLLEATSRFYFESFLLGLKAQKAAQSITLPTLIIQSGNDQIVDVPAVETWYQEIKAQNKTLRIFPDASHSIDFDAVWFRDYTTVLSEWLLARTVAA